MAEDTYGNEPLTWLNGKNCFTFENVPGKGRFSRFPNSINSENGTRADSPKKKKKRTIIQFNIGNICEHKLTVSP